MAQMRCQIRLDKTCIFFPRLKNTENLRFLLQKIFCSIFSFWRWSSLKKIINYFWFAKNFFSAGSNFLIINNYLKSQSLNEEKIFCMCQVWFNKKQLFWMTSESSENNFKNMRLLELERVSQFFIKIAEVSKTLISKG